MEQFGSALDCDAAPKAVMAQLKVGCVPPAAHAWIDDCGPLVAAPRSLTLACGDANLGLARLSWRRWGQATATARGVVRANDCDPDCAAGHFHSYPATVSVTRLTACGRARYYARLRVEADRSVPALEGRREKFTLGC